MRGLAGARRESDRAGFVEKATLLASLKRLLRFELAVMFQTEPFRSVRFAVLPAAVMAGEARVAGDEAQNAWGIAVRADVHQHIRAILERDVVEGQIGGPAPYGDAVAAREF